MIKHMYVQGPRLLVETDAVNSSFIRNIASLDDFLALDETGGESDLLKIKKMVLKVRCWNETAAIAQLRQQYIVLVAVQTPHDGAVGPGGNSSAILEELLEDYVTSEFNYKILGNPEGYLLNQPFEETATSIAGRDIRIDITKLAKKWQKTYQADLKRSEDDEEDRLSIAICVFQDAAIDDQDLNVNVSSFIEYDRISNQSTMFEVL